VPWPAPCLRTAAGTLDGDTTAAEHSGRIGIVGGAQLVVIDDGIALVLVPNLDAELVPAAAPGQLAIDGRELKAVVTGAVDAAQAFELGLGAADHEPIIARALEVETGLMEQELSMPRRHGGAVLVLGFESEGRLAGERRIGRVGTGRGNDP